MILQTESWPWRRVLAANGVTNGFTDPPDVLASSAPVGVMADSAAGYIDLGLATNSDAVPSAVKLKFYGTCADNATASVRVYGVSPIVTLTAEGVPQKLSWTHTLLVDYALTLSTATGVAGGAVSDTERYADTVVRTTGNANVSDQFVSPTGNVAAHALVNTQGFRTLLFLFSTGGSATGVNALYAGC